MNLGRKCFVAIRQGLVVQICRQLAEKTRLLPTFLHVYYCIVCHADLCINSFKTQSRQVSLRNDKKT